MCLSRKPAPQDTWMTAIILGRLLWHANTLQPSSGWWILPKIAGSGVCIMPQFCYISRTRCTFLAFSNTLESLKSYFLLAFSITRESHKHFAALKLERTRTHARTHARTLTFCLHIFLLMLMNYFRKLDSYPGCLRKIGFYHRKNISEKKSINCKLNKLFK